MRLRGAFVALLLFCAAACAQDRAVLTGIDVLEQEQFATLRDRTVGLLTNQTGIDSKGRRTIDVLANAPQVKLVKLFSVEHGLAGKQDTLHVNEQSDAASHLPVVNVYGTAAARTPTAEQMSGIDTLVIDIQDAGVRFFTYEASMAEFLTAAAKNKIEVLILDRPNPFNGESIQGPTVDQEKLWPNFPLPLPLRHGMTMGELATLLNDEWKLGAKLKVIEMQNWSRKDWFDDTKLKWIDPSPNLRSLTAATLYPGVAMLEAQGSNISVGRGTDTPFEIIGATWMDAAAARKLAAYLNKRNVPGVRFAFTRFTPSDNLFKGQECRGLKVQLTNRNKLDAGLLGAELTSALLKLFPQDFHVDANRKLIGDIHTIEELKAGKDPRTVAANWQGAIKAFRRKRAPYLLY